MSSRDDRAEARKQGRAEARKQGRDEGRTQGRDEGRKQGRDEGRNETLDETRRELRSLVQDQLTARGWTLSPAQQARLDACRDQPTLVRWYAAVATSSDGEAALR